MTDRNDALLNGHRVDVAGIRKDLLHLVCLFEAGRPIAQMAAQRGRAFMREQDEPFEPTDDLYHSLVETEATRLLLSSAVGLRTMLDQADLGEGFKADEQLCVGALTEKAKTSRLDLRQACNKIIHATRLDLKTTPYSATGEVLNALMIAHPASFRAVEPTVFLAGTHQSKRGQWSAALSINDFVAAAHLASIVYEMSSENARLERKLKRLALAKALLEDTKAQLGTGNEKG